MDKEQIIQLRNHHLKQGRNNDRKPIYPITKAECIIGDVGGGVEKVDTLPEKGEEGKIYYNTTDKKYYTYTNEGGFNETGSGIETVTTFGVVPKGEDMPSVDTQIPISPDEQSDFLLALPALYYQYTNDNIKLWIVLPQPDQHWAIIHPLDVNPNTIFYNSTHHYYFKIAPVPYVNSYNDSTGEVVIGYRYTPVVVCTEQTIILNDRCTWILNLEHNLKRIGFGILSPSCFCDMDLVDSVEFTQIGSIPYTEEPLLKAQVISGRFKAGRDNISIMLPYGITQAVGNPSIELDHRYEYSIFNGIFNLIDVTPNL